MHTAIGELQWLIQQHYREVTFLVEPGDHPMGGYILAMVDVQDTNAVVGAFIDRRLGLQIDGGLPL